MKKYIWKLLSWCSFGMSLGNMVMGFDKMLVYSADECNLHNAYVGGDAYNFIINGTYATGFFTLAAMFGIMSVGLLIVHYLSNKDK